MGTCSKMALRKGTKGREEVVLQLFLKVYLHCEPLQVFTVWRKIIFFTISCVTTGWKEILHCHCSWCRKVWSISCGLAAVTNSGFPINFRDFAGIPLTLICCHGYEFHVPTVWAEFVCLFMVWWFVCLGDYFRAGLTLSSPCPKQRQTIASLPQYKDLIWSFLLCQSRQPNYTWNMTAETSSSFWVYFNFIYLLFINPAWKSVFPTIHN